MAALDRDRLRERLEETLQRSRDDSDRQLDALLAEVRGIQTWLQDTFDQLEMLSVAVEDDAPRGVSDVNNHRQHLQRLQHTIREHQIPVQVALQKGKRHLDREPDVSLQTDLKNIQYFWDLLQGRVALLQELLGEGGTAPPLGTPQSHPGEGGTTCDNRRRGGNQNDDGFAKSSNFGRPSHRRIVERRTQGLIRAVEKLQRRTDELTSPGTSRQTTLRTQQTTLTTMNQSNPISISHGGCRPPDNLLARELSSSDESLNELMIDVNEYMASLVELENSSLDDDGYGSFGKKGLEFFSGESAENSAQESPRNKGACGFSSEDDLDEAVSSLEDLHMSWECLSSSPPASLPVFYRLPQPKHSTPRAETQDAPPECSGVSSEAPREGEKGAEGRKENTEEGKSVEEEETTVDSSPLTFEVTDWLPEAIKEQFEAFAEDLKTLAEFLENMTEQAASFQTPGDDLVSLQVFLEKHLAFKMQMDTQAVLRSAVVKEGHHLAGSLRTQGPALEAVLHTIEQRWAQLVRTLTRQHCAISLALESFRMDLAAPRGDDGEDLREAVAMETAQDAMEEMSLKLSGSGVSDSPTDIKVNSVVRFHLEELAEESWDLLSSSPEDGLLLSPHGSPPGAGAHSYELSDFTQQHQELAEWLGEIEGVLTDRDDLMMSEEQIKHLCKSYEIEMGLYQRRRDTFLQKGERLKAAYPDLFSDISDKLLAITKKWDLLRVNLAHEGGITPPGENEMVLAALEASIEHLQAWLSDMEAKMFVNDIYNISGVEDLEVRLKQHEALQLDIEAHAPSIASVLELCEKLEDDCHACRTYEEKEALQLAAINLERRWDAICMQAIDMQCRLEERLCTYRGLYQTTVGRYDLSSSASTLSEVATGSTDTSLDLEDFPSDADVIPFDAGEYESIVHGSAEFRKTRKHSSHHKFQTEARSGKQTGERGLSHSDGDVRPKKRTPKKYTDQRHSTCSLNPYSDDSMFSRNRRSTSDIVKQKTCKPSNRELYFNKKTSQSSSVASAIVTLDSEVLLAEGEGDIRDDNLFATIKGVLVDRTMSLDEGLNVLGVVEIHSVPQALSLSKRELFSRIAGHLMSSALLTQSDSELLKARDGKGRMSFPLVPSDSDKLEAGAAWAEFSPQEEEMYHSRESGISSDQEALLLSLEMEDDGLKEQEDELEEDPSWYQRQDTKSGANPEFVGNSVHKKGAASRDSVRKSSENDSSAESAQGYRKYGLSDRTLEILQEVMDTTSPFVSKLRQTNGRSRSGSARCYEEEEYDEREDSVDVASLLLGCYDEESAADCMEWDSGMSSYECTPLSTLGYGEEDRRRSDRKGGSRQKEERREEESSEDATSALFATTDDCPAEYAVQGVDMGEPDCTTDSATNKLSEEPCKTSEEDRKYFLGRYSSGVHGNELASCESRISGTSDTTQQGGDGYGCSSSTRGEGSSVLGHAGTLSTRRWQLHEEEMTGSDVLWHRRDGPGIRQLHPSASLIGDVDYRGPKSGVPTSPDKHSGHGSGAAEFITAPGDNGYHTEAARRVSFVTLATGQAGAGSDRGTSGSSGDGDSDGRMTNGADGNGSTQCHRPLVTTKHLQECETGASTNRDADMVVQNVYNGATEVVTRGDALDQFASSYLTDGMAGSCDGDAGNGHEVLPNSSSSGPEAAASSADLRLGPGPTDSRDVPDSAISDWDRIQAGIGGSIPYHSSNTLWTQEGILGNHRPASPSAKFEDDEMFRRFQSLERELLAEDDFLALPPYSRRIDVGLIDVEEDDALLKGEERFRYPPSGADADLELLEKKTYKQIDDLASSGAILEETTKNLKELLNGFGGQRPPLDASGSDSDASTVKESNETTLSGSKTFLSGGEHDLNEDASSGPNFENRTSTLQTRVLEEEEAEEDFETPEITTNVTNLQEQHETLQVSDGSSQEFPPPPVRNESWDVTGTKVSVDEQVPCAFTNEGIKTIDPSNTEILETDNVDHCPDSKSSTKQDVNEDLPISDPGCFGKRRIIPRKIPLQRFISPMAAFASTHMANGACAYQRQVEVVQDHRCLHTEDDAPPLQQNSHKTDEVPRYNITLGTSIGTGETGGLCNGKEVGMENGLSPPSYEQACGEVQQVDGLRLSEDSSQCTRGADWQVNSSSVASATGPSKTEEELSCHAEQLSAFQSTVNSIGGRQEDCGVSFSTATEGANNAQSNHSIHPDAKVPSNADIVDLSGCTGEPEPTEQMTTIGTSAAEAQLKVTSSEYRSVRVDRKVCDGQFTAKESSQLVLEPAGGEDISPVLGDTRQLGEREPSSTAFSAASEVDNRQTPSNLSLATTQQILHSVNGGSVTTTYTDSLSTSWASSRNISQTPDQPSVPSIQPASNVGTSGFCKDASQLQLLSEEEDGKRSSSHPHHPNGTLPGGVAIAQSRTASSLTDALNVEERQDESPEQSDGSTHSDAVDVSELHQALQGCGSNSQGRDESAVRYGGETSSGHSRDVADEVSSHSDVLSITESAGSSQGQDLDSQCGTDIACTEGTVLCGKQSHVAVQTLQPRHGTDAPSHNSYTHGRPEPQTLAGSSLSSEWGHTDGKLHVPPQVDMTSQATPASTTRCQDQLEPGDILLPSQQRSRSTGADMSNGGVPHAGPPSLHAEPPSPHAEPRIRRRKPEQVVRRAEEHSKSSEGRAPLEAGHEETRSWPRLERVLRLALPVQALLFLMLLLVSVLPLMLEPECCSTANNLHRSIHPTLRHVNGPSPT